MSARNTPPHCNRARGRMLRRASSRRPARPANACGVRALHLVAAPVAALALFVHTTRAHGIGEKQLDFQNGSHNTTHTGLEGFARGSGRGALESTSQHHATGRTRTRASVAGRPERTQERERPSGGKTPATGASKGRANAGGHPFKSNVKAAGHFGGAQPRMWACGPRRAAIAVCCLTLAAQLAAVGAAAANWSAAAGWSLEVLALTVCCCCAINAKAPHPPQRELLRQKRSAFSSSPRGFVQCCRWGSRAHARALSRPRALRC